MKIFLILFFGSLLALACFEMLLGVYDSITRKSEKKDGEKND